VSKILKEKKQQLNLCLQAWEKWPLHSYKDGQQRRDVNGLAMTLEEFAIPFNEGRTTKLKQ
jgi:hypothetical protein